MNYDNPETVTCQRIRAFLKAHPGSTFREIAAGAFVSIAQVRMKCVPLLMRENLIHVSNLRPTKGRALREYSDGPLLGEPVRPLCNRERLNRMRREWRQASGFYEARKAARRLVNPPDRVLAALMGLSA